MPRFWRGLRDCYPLPTAAIASHCPLLVRVVGFRETGDKRVMQPAPASSRALLVQRLRTLCSVGRQFWIVGMPLGGNQELANTGGRCRTPSLQLTSAIPSRVR